MSNGWAGADPTQTDDGSGATYELGVKFRADLDVSITGVRIWHGASSNTVAGRTARLWTTGGSSLATKVVDDSLPPGWTAYSFAAPVARSAGDEFVISYGTRQYYGAVAGGYPAPSADAAVTALAGYFVETIGTFPTNLSSAFYGVDIVYDIAADNLPPSVTLAVTPGPLSVSAVATVTDDAPVSQYAWEWGDGQTSTTATGAASHNYASPGLYPVLVTVTDAGGLKDAAAAVAVVRGAGGGAKLSQIAVEVAERLALIDGLHAYSYAPGAIVPPAVMVLNPDPGNIRYDATYGRGLDVMTLPLLLLVSRATERTGQQLVREFLDGSGGRSIKAALESSGDYATLDVIRMSVSGVDGVAIGGVEYIAALIDLEIGASGR